MSRIVNSDGRQRRYSSELRAEQAEETRNRILDATIRVMAGGIARLSIPDVARAAGVSVPTVYRHFGTKGDLLAAVYPYVTRRAGLAELITPGTVDEFRQMVVTMFSQLETLGADVRAAMASPAAEEARKHQMPARYALSRRFAATVLPHASEVQQQRLARVLLVLASSYGMRMWRDHLGASVEEAADDIDWVLRALVSGTTKGNDR